VRIIELEAENFKRLKAVRIVPGDERILVIKGKNGAGKSAVLDALGCAIDSRLVPERPVRDGADEAYIRLDLGTLVVERKWTQGGAKDYLVVRDADGVRQSSPQTILDALYNRIALDPSSFLRLSSKDQVEVLRRVTGLDCTDLEEKRAKLYTDRTIVNRELETAEARIRAFKAPPADTPDTEIDLQDTLRRIEKLRQLQMKRDALVGVRAAIKEVEAKLEQLRGDEKRITEEGKAFAADIGNPKDVVAELADMNSRAGLADITNRHVRSKRDLESLRATRSEKDAETRRLTAAIEAIDAEKRKRISAAALPGGISFDEEHVLLRGIPLAQASAAEQIRAAVEVGLAENKPLRVLRIRDGSLLDDDSLALLDQIAEEKDCWIWLERVGEGGTGILIEDGEVVAAPTVPKAPVATEEFDL
jgi:hypothetical protein